MSDEVEKVTILVMDNHGGSSIRVITDEHDVNDTKWPNLVQVFLEELQGIGYKFEATPEEMVDVLEEFHQDIMRAECNGCDEPIVEAQEQASNKYPYVGYYSGEGGITIVHFVSPGTGTCMFTTHKRNSTGELASNWAEEDFKKVSL